MYANLKRKNVLNIDALKINNTMKYNFKDNGKTKFFFDEFGLLLERSSWSNNHIGDALWRQALGIIAFGSVEMIEATFKHLYKDRKWIRHPLWMRDDTSRDQVIMINCAFRLRFPDGHTIMKGDPFRISEKFTWVENWFWLHERYTTWRLILSYQLIGCWFAPMYAVHLLCWMIYCSQQKMPFLKWVLLKRVPKDNYLCRALLGEKQDIEIEKVYRPMNDFRWQRDTPWLEGYFLTDEESEFNDIGTEVLRFILNRQK